MNTTRLEYLLKRDRWIIGAGLTAICALSWWYLFAGAGTGMSTIAMTTWKFPPPVEMRSMIVAWDLSYWIIMLLMWWVMMIAMMLPSAAPTILLYARVHRHSQKTGSKASPIPPTALFAAGYFVSWLGFSAAATLFQWLFERSGMVHAMLMWSTSHALSGAFLVAAGLYQATPLKNACLEHCRSPISFLMRNWRGSAAGGLRMGVEHGLYCVGCCWFLMALLFVGGIMNLVWIAGLAILVLVEKLLPAGVWIGRISGVFMVAGGVYLLAG